jgi:hypothetical protein
MIMANGDETRVEVLAERITNLSKRVDEQVVISKTSVDAALTAISVAKVDQERTVSVAFNASQLAISKTEEAQKESNRLISALTNDVTRLKESQAQGSGNGKGMRDMVGWVFGALMFFVAAASYLSHLKP